MNFKCTKCGDVFSDRDAGCKCGECIIRRTRTGGQVNGSFLFAGDDDTREEDVE